MNRRTFFAFLAALPFARFFAPAEPPVNMLGPWYSAEIVFIDEEGNVVGRPEPSAFSTVPHP
jgi:hypothetical protein